jgi:hypothetical protein
VAEATRKVDSSVFFVPYTDPRYSSGWNYLSGKNLNTSKEKSADKPQEIAAILQTGSQQWRKPDDPTKPQASTKSASKSEPNTGQTAQQAARERELFARLGAVKQYPIAPDELPPPPDRR